MESLFYDNNFFYKFYFLIIYDYSVINLWCNWFFNLWRVFWVRFIIHYTILIISVISREQILLRSWPIDKLFFSTIRKPSHILLLFNIKSKNSFHRAVILVFYLCWAFLRIFKVELIKDLRVSSWHWFLELVFKFILSIYFTRSVRFSISTFMILIHKLGILYDRNLSLILFLCLWCSRW